MRHKKADFAVKVGSFVRESVISIRFRVYPLVYLGGLDHLLDLKSAGKNYEYNMAEI